MAAKKATIGAGRPLKGKRRRVCASFTLPPELLGALAHKAKQGKQSKSEALERILERSMVQDVQMQTLHLPVLSIHSFCKAHHIKKLSVFGSALSGQLAPGSDVDLLVEFEAEHEPSLFGLGKLELELSNLLNGKTVDLRTAEDLSKYFREQVMHSAVPIYG